MGRDMGLLEHLLNPIRLMLALIQQRRERADRARRQTGAGQVALGYRVSGGSRKVGQQ